MKSWMIALKGAVSVELDDVEPDVFEVNDEDDVSVMLSFLSSS